MFQAFAIPWTGGDERVRTDDPLLAKQVLSQLSYTPIFTLQEVSRALLRESIPGPSKLNNDRNFRSVPDLGC